MRAVVIDSPGGPEQLRLAERPDPEPGPGEVLVQVAAAGVNRADLLQRAGRYPPPPGASDVPGLEIAGTVAALGPGATGWAIGDEVCAVLAGGGYAELAVVPAGCLLPLPSGTDLLTAAAVPEVFTTAHDNLFTRGGLQPGETVLIHGGASGVGTAAVQLAARAGCTVVVTAGTPRGLAACADLGAAAGIDYRAEDFVDSVERLTDGRGVDVILDIMGAVYLERNLRVLATEGRLVVIGLQGGVRAELDLGRMLSKRLQVLGSTLRARSADEKAVLAARLRDEVWPGFADGSLKPVVDRVFPLEEAAAAHAHLEAGGHVGKVLLDLRDR